MIDPTNFSLLASMLQQVDDSFVGAESDEAPSVLLESSTRSSRFERLE